MVTTINYRGFQIAVTKVTSRFGILYRAENNIGEPYNENIAYKSKSAAIVAEQNEIDSYLAM